MDIFLAVIGGIMILTGIAGCILPVIPGPPVSWVGILLLEFTRFADYSTGFLAGMAALALVVTLLDYVVPIWGTKRYGGTKAGVWGATLGMVFGLFFFPPIGIILGPLIGAIIAETARGASNRESIRAGLGAFIGFLLGVGLKLIASFVIGFYFFRSLFT